MGGEGKGVRAGGVERGVKAAANQTGHCGTPGDGGIRD